jgi:hypothetical protein
MKSYYVKHVGEDNFEEGLQVSNWTRGLENQNQLRMEGIR